MHHVKADGSIFISIASYRDDLLTFTLKEAYKMAAKPNRLVFAVVEQETQDNALDLDSLKFKDQIRYVRVDPEQSRGCCWARSLVQSLYNNEDFFLQIDSHTAFKPHWDVELTQNLVKLKQYHDNPVITNYPHALDFDDKGRPIKESPQFAPGSMNIIIPPPLDEPTFTHASGWIIGRATGVQAKQQFVHGVMLSAGALFSFGSIVDEVPYDPFVMFGGEETTLALRLFTNGYNIFHQLDMPMFHKYTDEEKRTRTLFWDPSEDEKRVGFSSSKVVADGDKRVKSVLEGTATGVYGLGKIRSLDDYKIVSGIDYPNRTYKPVDLWKIDYKQKLEPLLKRERGK